MSSAQIKAVMEIKGKEMREALLELSKRHTEKSKELTDIYGRDMFDLNVQLRRAEAEEAYQAELEAFNAAKEAAEEEDEGWNVGLASRQTATRVSPQAYADGGDELCYNCNGYVERCDCDAREEAGRALVGEARAPCYNCDGSVGSCGCGAPPYEEAFQSNLSAEAQVFVAAAQEDHHEDHHEGTKLKWVSSTNPETYSVAIVKKGGILEVKRVTDGGGHCHNTTVCQCIPCSEIHLSNRLGVPNPPWRQRAPLLKTFFSTEAEWRASLPGGGVRGSVKTTVPAISARTLKNLCVKPLSGTTDGLKLKELQERFSGGTMLLMTTKEQLEIEHIYYDIASYPETWCHQIHCKNQERSVMDFSDLGDSPRSNGKPQLMALWKGLYIDLSHLF